MRLVYYDLTRVISRLGKPHATGIDRVDFRYLSYFYNCPNTVLVGLAFSKNRFFLIDRKFVHSIVSLLSDRVAGREFSDNLVIFGKSLKRSIRRKLRAHRLLRRGFAPVPQSAAKHRNLDGVYYFNVSHHGLNSTDALASLKSALAARVIIFLHDLIPIDFPEHCELRDSEVHHRRLVSISDHADLVIVNSDCTEKSLIKYVKSNGRCPIRTSKVQIGVEDAVLETEKCGIGDGVFLAVGTIEERKNYLLLLSAWSRIFSQHKNAPLLLFVGQEKKGYSACQQFLEDNRQLEPFVSFRTGVCDGELWSLLSKATVLLMPSFAEGWGMPVVEALSLGTPVIASNIDAHKEASQGFATLLDPHDLDNWVESITEAWRDAEWQAVGRVPKGFVPPTWDSHFQRVEEQLATL